MVPIPCIYMASSRTLIQVSPRNSRGRRTGVACIDGRTRRSPVPRVTVGREEGTLRLGEVAAVVTYAKDCQEVAA